jgi:hypothetical protein
VPRGRDVPVLAVATARPVSGAPGLWLLPAPVMEEAPRP